MNLCFEFTFKTTKSITFLDNFTKKVCDTFIFTDQGVKYAISCQNLDYSKPSDRVILIIAVCSEESSDLVQGYAEIFKYVDFVESSYKGIYSKLYNNIEDPSILREALRKACKEYLENPFK